MFLFHFFYFNFYVYISEVKQTGNMSTKIFLILPLTIYEYYLQQHAEMVPMDMVVSKNVDIVVIREIVIMSMDHVWPDVTAGIGEIYVT